MVAATEAMGEAAAFGEVHGVACAGLADLLANTRFASAVYEDYGALIAAKAECRRGSS